MQATPASHNRIPASPATEVAQRILLNVSRVLEGKHEVVELAHGAALRVDSADLLGAHGDGIEVDRREVDERIAGQGGPSCPVRRARVAAAGRAAGADAPPARPPDRLVVPR